MPGRLGVLGGTFDPPHIGHLIVAQDACERLSLDRLLVVPAARPPHREPVFDPDTRFEWVRLAFEGEERIEVSAEELRREGTSWTVDTLDAIRRASNPDDLVLIVGADQLRAFPEWRDPERILRIARLAVMTRSGEEIVGTGVPHEVIEVTRVDLSSTRIRRRLEEGQSIRYMVPETLRPRIERAWSARSTGSRL